jgi:hypothetical protein
VFGSPDGGLTLADGDAEFEGLMRDAAAVLNLKEHAVRDSGQRLAAPADIEGHRGADGRLYLLDFARTWPPFPRLGYTEHWRALSLSSLFLRLFSFLSLSLSLSLWLSSSSLSTPSRQEA